MLRIKREMHNWVKTLSLLTALHKDARRLSLPSFPKTCEVLVILPTPSLPSRPGHLSYTKSNPHGLSQDGSLALISLLPNVWREWPERGSYEPTIALWPKDWDTPTQWSLPHKPAPWELRWLVRFPPVGDVLGLGAEQQGARVPSVPGLSSSQAHPPTCLLVTRHPGEQGGSPASSQTWHFLSALT